MSARLEDMASERLTRAAYEGLYEALNLKRLIAFVGSGVSLVYGNLTWEQFRDEVIKLTHAKLDRTRQASPEWARDLQRALDALRTLEKSDMDQATMVFDLCERAFNRVEQNDDRSRSHFRRTLKDFFVSDRYFATNTLLTRLGGQENARLQRKLAALDDSSFYSGLARFYSAETIQAVADCSGSDRLQLLAWMLRRDWSTCPAAQGALPIDRRSLIAVLLAFAGLAVPRITLLRAVGSCFFGAFRGKRSSLDGNELPKPRPLPNPRPLLDPLNALKGIHVRRFLTTNYDLELENLFMFNDVRSRKRLPVDVGPTLDQLTGFSRTDGGRSWARRLANGLVVRSDVYDGFSTGRLFEFGIGSVDNDVHIFHLHGRADLPETMVATDSDYNRNYREERVSRASFDRAYDATISGNPILFIGSGMSEAELTRTLRHRVSNPKLHRDSPVFVLRGAIGTPGKLILEQLDLYNRLGVHVIHYGHPRRGEQWSLRRALLLVDAIARTYDAHLAGSPKDTDFADESAALVKEIVAGRVRLKDYALIAERLPFDRSVVRWLIGRKTQAFWKAGSRAGREAKRRRASLEEYLGKLQEKLHSASMIRELEEIGREADAFYRRKSTRILPRRVWAYGQRRHPGFDLPGDDKFGSRHVESLSSPSPSPGSMRWRIRKRDGTTEEINQVDKLLPRAARATGLPRVFGGDRTATVVVGDRGAGKGTLLRRLVEGLVDRPETLVINCSFGLEADSIVSMVEKFLVDRQVADGTGVEDEPVEGFESRRQKMRTKLSEVPWSRHPLLVIAAVDRLFNLEGKPLSPEFEWMLRLLLEPPLRLHLLVIGSRRCEHWFRAAMETGDSKIHRLVRIERVPEAVVSDADFDPLIHALGWPAGLCEAPEAVRKTLRTTGVNRRAARVAGMSLDALREPDEAVPPEEISRQADIGRVAQEIVKTLAFIGLPCEGEVLMVAPAVASLLRDVVGTDAAAQRDTFVAALDRALKRRLLLLVEPSGSCPVQSYEKAREAAASGKTDWPGTNSPARYAIGTRQRFVLHRIVFQEMRNRYGLPLGETVLNNSYNLSLFAAQPDDLPTVEAEAASDLETLADTLTDGWRRVQLASDEATPPAGLDARSELERSYLGERYVSDARNPDRLAVIEDFQRGIRMHSSLAVASARAAGGVLRGILSASNILGLDIDSARPPGPSVIRQQKIRIRQLLDTAIDLQAARGCRTEAKVVRRRQVGCRADLRQLWKLALDRRIGSSPSETAEAAASALFDPDGTKLARRWIDAAQEREDDARLPFRDQLVRPLWADLAGIADPANHPPNVLDRRPFYEEEIVWLLNERAMLSLAQGDLYSAELTFNLAFAANARLEGERYQPNRCRMLVNRALVWIERGKINEARRCVVDLRLGMMSEPEALAPHSDEGRLILALAKAFESLCDDLQGLTERADRGYCEALADLDALRQQRAIAIVQYHRASLLQLQPGRRDDAARCFTRALSAAQAGRHTDIVYRIRIGKAGADRHRKAISDAQALAIYGAAREYGEQFEMHRVTVQALGASTRLRLEAGEVETAAHDCSRALALATRNGMALWRISLRILTGQTLQKRGDAPNARFMMERAAAEAERIGYQRAVDQASSELMRSAQQAASPP